MSILQSQERPVFSTGILRLVGYSLLLMTVVNLSFLPIAAQIDLLWQFQTMGAIIEKSPFTLLGMVLIFLGKRSDRTAIEVIWLKVLSWISLMTAVVLMLTIPLNIHNSWQIYHHHNATTDLLLATQEDNIQQFKQHLAAANSKDEIAAILQQQVRQTVNIPDSANIQKLKTDIIANLQNDRDRITIQAEPFRAQKRSLLLKQCLKWNLGALISAILFLMIWNNTEWARSLQD
jgi:hypothetical protein